jgi:hypothetical protein
MTGMTVNYKNRTIVLMSGDIILFRNNFIWHEPITYLSALVRFFTKCKYNHCGLVVHNWGTPFISEAVNDGVITRPAAEHILRSKTRIVVLRPKSIVHMPTFCKRANSAVGKKYDFKALLFFQLIFRTTGKWIGPTGAKAAEQMVCSEFVAWAHQLDNWWLLSSRELLDHPDFRKIFIE